MFKIQKQTKVITINKSFRLPMDLIEEMQTIAQNKGISLNKLVQLCCEYALNNLDKE